MIVLDYDGVEHDIAGTPSPDCYGCLGTGYLVDSVAVLVLRAAASIPAIATSRTASS
jgi:hypothetical protein